MRIPIDGKVRGRIGPDKVDLGPDRWRLHGKGALAPMPWPAPSSQNPNYVGEAIGRSVAIAPTVGQNVSIFLHAPVAHTEVDSSEVHSVQSDEWHWLKDCFPG